MGIKESIIKLAGGIPKSQPLDSFFKTTRNLVKSQTFDSSQAPATKKTAPQIRRVSNFELEQAYLQESTIFNIINKNTQIIMSGDYTLVGEEEDVFFFQEFFDSVGKRGGETEWDDILRAIFKYQFIYGNSWNELIPAKKDRNKIVDLELVDPKKMDYAKDTTDQEIILDPFGEPIGYVQTLPPHHDVGNQKYSVPEIVPLDSNQIFLPPDKVAHHKLYTVGDRFYGVGIVEPAYDTIRRKLVIEKALANWLKRSGFPTRWVKVGDQMHEPTEEVLQRAAEQIKEMDEMGIFSYPYWMDTGFDEVKSPEKMQQLLDYYVRQIVTVGGLPQALATGEADTTNRATLNRLESLAKLSLKDIVRSTVASIEKQIIIPVAESNGVLPVKIQWGEILIEELDDKAKRLATYAGAGLLTPDEKLEDLVRLIENLPERVIRETGDVDKGTKTKD